MNRHGSVSGLMAAGSAKKLALVLAAAFAVETALFYWLAIAPLRDGAYMAPWRMIRQSGIPIVCGAAYFALCLILSLFGCEYGSRTGYTLRRLRVSSKEIFFRQCANNAAWFLIFWFTQACVLYLLCLWYVSAAPADKVGEQTVLFSFYTDSFMHSMLPLGEYARYIRNIVVCLALGVATACFPPRQRQGGFCVGAVLLAVVCAIFFASPMGDAQNNIILPICALVLSSVSAGTVFECSVEIDKPVSGGEEAATR